MPVKTYLIQSSAEPALLTTIGLVAQIRNGKQNTRLLQEVRTWLKPPLNQVCSIIFRCRGSDGEKVLPIITFGGAGGIRTRYLLTASQTFSQVNYGPLSPNVI